MCLSFSQLRSPDSPTADLMLNAMRGIIAFVILLYSVGAWEQKPFSFSSEEQQTILLRRHQPWSILLAQNPQTSNCAIVSIPELAQHHRAVAKPGDVIVLNKTISTFTGVDGEEAILEIIGYDRETLRQKTEELCSSLNDLPSSIDIEAEYEVVS